MDPAALGALASPAEAVVVLDPHLRIVFLNQSARRLMGYPASPHGREFHPEIPDWSNEALRHKCEVVFSTHVPVRYTHHDTRNDTWIEVRIFPSDEGVTVYLRDISDSKRPHSRSQPHQGLLEDPGERNALLFDVSRALAGALNVEEVARAITRSAGTALGALTAGVAVVSPAGTSARFVSLRPLPSSVRRAWEEFPLSGGAPLVVCIKEQRYLFHESREDVLSEFPQFRADFDAAGIEGVAHLPLIGVGGATIGLLLFNWVHPVEFPGELRDTLVTVSRLCAQAMERALLYEEKRSLAESLQRVMLPERLPAPEGWMISAMYRPSMRGMLAAGDWYDAFETRPGHLTLVLGDVAGHGLEATRAMGELRASLRAYAFENPDPAATLERAGNLLDHWGAVFATAFVADVDLDTGLVRWASAGHPPPITITHTSTSIWPMTQDPPLGAPRRRPMREGTHRISPGEAVLIFTDGLIERRDADITDGLVKLADVLKSASHHPPTRESLEILIEEMVGPAGPEDDVCAIGLYRVHASGDFSPPGE